MMRWAPAWSEEWKRRYDWKWWNGWRPNDEPQDWGGGVDNTGDDFWAKQNAYDEKREAEERINWE